jgi:hypothetical protein
MLLPKLHDTFVVLLEPFEHYFPSQKVFIFEMGLAVGVDHAPGLNTCAGEAVVVLPLCPLGGLVACAGKEMMGLAQVAALKI